jgi:hypothetical protein
MPAGVQVIIPFGVIITVGLYDIGPVGVQVIMPVGVQVIPGILPVLPCFPGQQQQHWQLSPQQQPPLAFIVFIILWQALPDVVGHVVVIGVGVIVGHVMGM